jgi:hypothetical protein
MTPSPDRSQMAKRGFFIKDEDTRQTLEKTPQFFRAGFAHAVETGDPAETGARLDSVDRAYRGFAYEGAAMGLAILDALTLGRHDRISEFINGSASRYAHGVHVGLGFALAKVPRFRRQLIAPRDPFLRWRSLDGYGFYRGFFQTDRYVLDHQREPDFGWPGGEAAEYAARALDQGIGRALWFIGGADVGQVTGLIGGFAVSRHADLWSGVGVAATYAGGAAENELWLLAERGGQFRPQLAQGAALAALTRARAGILTSHTGRATGVLCGMTAEDAAAVAETALARLPDDAEVPSFEVWRQRVATRFTGLSSR